MIAERASQPQARPLGSPALDAIREWVAALEAAAGPGWHVRREPNPPYGWKLVDGQGVTVRSGSLDQLEQWLKLHRHDSPTLPHIRSGPRPSRHFREGMIRPMHLIEVERKNELSEPYETLTEDEQRRARRL